MHDSEHYQKHLIPVNIVVILLSLVAAFSLVFFPLFGVDLGAVGEGLSALGAFGGGSEGSEETGISPTGDISVLADETGEDSMEDDLLTLALDNMSGVEISLSVYQIARFSFAKEPAEVLLDGAVETIGKATERVAVNMLLGTFVEAAGDLDLDADGVDADKLFDKLNALERANASNKEKLIAEFADELQAQLGEEIVDDEIKAEVCDELLSLYDETVSKTENGKFSIEALVCISLSESAEDGTAVTTYQDLFGSLFGENFLEDAEPLKEAAAMLARLTSIFVFVMLAFAALWLVLAVFAFVHLFLSEKQFLMWYVKLFGFLPCLVFGVIPFAARTLAPFLGEIGSLLSVLGAITTMTWVSGGCYGLLWLVSIFWAHPVKKRIRQAEDDEFLLGDDWDDLDDD